MISSSVSRAGIGSIQQLGRPPEPTPAEYRQRIMDRNLNQAAIHAIALAVVGAMFITACGSGTVEAGDTSTSLSAVAAEPSVGSDQVDRQETSSLPFVVISEDLEAGDPYDVAVVSDQDTFTSLGIDDPVSTSLLTWCSCSIWPSRAPVTVGSNPPRSSCTTIPTSACTRWS